MNNWLVEISRSEPTDGELLYEALEKLSVPELQKLAFDLDPLSQPTRVDDLSDKIFQAERQGRELAREDQTLDKIAFLPALAAGAARLAPLAGKAVGALGGAKGIVGGIAKDMAISGAANKVMGALKPAAPAAAAAGEIAGGFKYAFAGNVLRQAAGYVTKHPGTALTAAGAVGGALMAPRDPQTGQKQYLKGALIGGVGTAGVNALSNGAIANKMRASVLNRQNPLLGQGTRRYLMDSAAATQGKSPISSSLRSQQTQYGKVAPAAAQPATPSVTSAASPASAVPAPPAQSSDWTAAHRGVQNMRERAGWDAMHAVGMDPLTQTPLNRAPSPISPARTAGYTGGPTMGSIKLGYGRGLKEKKANQQTLTYDPATKTFTRQHLTPSQGSADLKALGATPIPAGYREPVRSTLAKAVAPARKIL